MTLETHTGQEAIHEASTQCPPDVSLGWPVETGPFLLKLSGVGFRGEDQPPHMGDVTWIFSQKPTELPVLGLHEEIPPRSGV